MERGVDGLLASSWGKSLVLESIQDGVVALQHEGLVVYCNPAAEMILGFPGGEMVHQSFHTLIHHRRLDGTEYGEDECPIYGAIWRGERSRVATEIFWTKAGQPVRVEYASAPVLEDGRVVGGVVVFRSIEHERRERARAELRNEIVRIAAAYLPLDQSCPRMLAALCTGLGFEAGAYWGPGETEGDFRRHAVWVAPGTELAPPFGKGDAVPAFVCGWVGVRVTTDTADDATDPAASAALAAGMRRLLCFQVGSGQQPSVIALWGRQPLQADPDLVPTVEAIRALLEQIGARRAAEREVVRAQAALDHAHEVERARELIMNAVAHELRTPITAIVGYTELLQDELASTLTERQQAYLRSVGANCRQLHRLVEDLLDNARLQAGTFRLDIQDVEVGELLAQVVDSLVPMAQARGQNLELDRPSLPLALQADPGRLEQVFANLIHNAIKFTPPGGRVRVRAIDAPAGARVEVADTGPGIPVQAQSHLFEPFFQVSAEAAATARGTGLGLPIAKALVEAHGGTIDFESHEGEGSTFWVFFPKRPREIGPDAAKTCL